MIFFFCARHQACHSQRFFIFFVFANVRAKQLQKIISCVFLF